MADTKEHLALQAPLLSSSWQPSVADWFLVCGFLCWKLDRDGIYFPIYDFCPIYII